MPHRSLWLDEALSPGEPAAPPLEGAARADVAIMGGGYAGLWTAIRIKQREPSCDVVVLEQDICGGGASGRNGGFAISWWAKLGTLVQLCGADGALELARACEAAVDELGAFCDEHGIDAQYHRGGHLWTTTSQAQSGAWDGVMATCRELGVMPFEEWSVEETVRRSGTRPPPRGPFRSLRGDRAAGAPGARAAPRGARARRSHPRGHARHEARPPLARRAAHAARRASRPTASSIATNAWAVGLRELHTRLAVISSDIVATIPMPDRLARDRLDEARVHQRLAADDLLLPHDRRRPHRLRQGRLGHRAGRPHRAALRPRREAGRARSRSSFHEIYPMLADVPIATDWCGPIDRTRTGLPIFGHLGGRSHIVYGVGFSGNGVAPAVVGGRILSSLALGIADEWSACGLVDGRQGRFPPDPVRFLGAHVVREAVARKEEAEMEGREPNRLAVALASLAPAGMIPKKSE